MAGTTAVRRAEEPIKPIRNISMLDQIGEPFNALARRAYEIFESNGHALGRDLENWFQAERELLQRVFVNITESDESFEVKAEVPGFNEKEIEVGLEPRRVTITGKRETKKEATKGKTVCAESCSDQIFRIVELPAEIEADKATATLKNGVLELTLPKLAKAQALRIHPKAG